MMSAKYFDDSGLLFRGPFFRERFTFSTVGDSMTRQADADSCDINRIIERYDRSGTLPTGRVQGVYDDVTGLQGDYAERIIESRAVQAQVSEERETNG